MKRLTISNSKISFYEPVYAKCSNSHLLEIQKQVKRNIPFYDIKEYRSQDCPEEKLEVIYEKLSKLEDVLEKNGIENIKELDLILQGLINVYQENVNLKNELAKLKQKAIVPKYQVGQTLFRIDFGAIVPFVVNEIYVQINANKSISIQYFDYVGLVIEENELFATREEAEQKLAEIKGG